MFREYVERSLSVMPIQANSKKPTLDDWSRFCIKLPLESELESWEFAYSVPRNSNIGLCCGPASGIIALDIDTDDKRILDLCPPSPVRRRGKKGEVRFFKWREGINTAELLGKTVEVMSTGKQVVIPPSIHPDGMAYKWITPYTLDNFDVSDLPDFDMGFTTELQKFKNEFSIDGAGVGDSGRNNKLKEIVSSMAARGEAQETIVHEIYNVDMSNHNPRLFTDPKERFKATNEEDALKNAQRFVISILSSLARSGVLPAPTNQEKVKVALVNLKAIKEINQPKKHKKLPRLPGIGQELFEDIYNNSWVPRSQFSYMSALQILSQTIGLRVCYRGVYANLYQYGIAPTGAGKESPLRKTQSYIAGIDKRLIATGSDITSASSLHVYLEKHPERFIVMNEADKHLKRVGNEKTNMGLREMLTECYDVGKTLHGKQVLKNKGKEVDTYEDIEKFYLSMMLFSTPQGFASADFNDLQDTGYFARYFFYVEDRFKKAPYKSSVDETANPEILARLRAIHTKGQSETLVGFDVNTYQLQATAEVDEYEKVLFEKINQIKEKEWNGDQKFLGITNRFFQNVKKFAMIHHVAKHGDGYQRIMELESMRWAEEAVTAINNNMMLELNKHPGGSLFEKDCAKIVRYALKRGQGVKRRDITHGAGLSHKRFIAQYLKHLVDDSEALIYDKTSKTYIYNAENDG